MNALRDRVRTSGSYRWWSLGVLLMGFFTVGVSITILTAVLPDIAREFHVGAATIAWVVTGPMLVTGIMTPTFGKAGDLYGRKRVYLLGWGFSAVFALGAALSWNAGALVAFRLLGAAAGAATAPASMALILSSFGPHQRAKAMGIWSFAGAGAPVVGLVVGGPLVDLIGWRWIFGVQLPLTLPALLLSWFVLREDRTGGRPRFDVVGSVTLGAAIGALLYGINQGGAGAWTRPDVVAALVVAPLLGLAFVRVERRHVAPLVPLEYFRRSQVSLPIVIQAVSHVPYMGAFFMSPFFLHGVLHYDNALTSFALMPRPLANSLLSVLAGFAAARVGERSTTVAGMAVLAGGMVVMAFLGASSTFAHVAVAQILTGAGLGLAYPGLMSSVANAVKESDLGVVSAVQNMAWTIGAVAGMQGLQTFQEIRARTAGDVAAFRQTFMVGAAVALAALLLALRMAPARTASATAAARGGLREPAER